MRRLLVAGLAAVTLLGACASGPTTVSLQAEPMGGSSPSPSPSPEQEPSPTEASPSPSPTTTTPVGPRAPTDTDRARFVAAHEPAGASTLEDVAADLDGDGVDELVFAYVQHGRRAHVDVAWWNGTSYEIGFADDGGEATSLDRLQVSDVNGDGSIELVTHQSGEDDAASATLWRVLGAGQVETLVAVDGCHDGSNTYGAAGVRIADDDGDGADEIEATCDESPLPSSQWSSHTYVWQGDAYRYTPDELL